MNKNNRITCQKIVLAEIKLQGKTQNPLNFDYSFNEEDAIEEEPLL